MHISQWEASRSGAGIAVAMTDAGGVRHKQFVKKIVSQEGTVTAYGGDGARFPLNAGRDTSAEVASIAGGLIDVDVATLKTFTATDARLAGLAASIRKLAASALGQRQ
jgi:hypothetical protein